MTPLQEPPLPNPTRILLRGGMVLDGEGRPPVRADVLVEGERIADVGRFGDARADRVIVATDRVVAPGFIDPHNHGDTSMDGGITRHPLADNLVRQGITTILCNQCGGATYPIAPFLDEVDRVRPVTNVAMLASHGRTRGVAAERLGRPDPCPELWAETGRRLREEMESGAFGVAACPLARTQEEIPTAELIEAGRAAAPCEGVYVSHIREEGETGGHLDAIEEVLTVARESGARGQVSHLKIWGRPNWGQTDAALDIFDRARREGVAMAADQYPYEGGCRSFYTLLWRYQNAEPRDAAWRRDATAEVRRQIDILGGPHRLYLASREGESPYDAKTLEEVAEMMGLPFEQVPVELFLSDPRPRLSAFFLMINEADARVFMQSEHTMVGTDAAVVVPGVGSPHPRCFGTYPRLLGKYVREEKLMPLERMVHRMTARVADQFNIRDRGRVTRR